MLNSLYIFLMKMNNKHPTDGNFVLAVVEFIATVIIVAIIRNT